MFHSASNRGRWTPRIVLFLLLAVAAAPIARGQSSVVVIPGVSGGFGGPAGQIPSQVYFTGLPTFYNGDYRDSLNLFLSQTRNSIKSSNSQWIDAVPYFTMAGECYYQMGQPQAALNQYDAALKLFVAYSDWMMRVQFPQSIAPAMGAAQATPWGQSKRGATVGAFSNTFTMSQGQLNQTQVLQQGGVVQSAVAFPVNVAEIVRCTCLAIRRHRELLGPNSEHDPLTQSVLETLSRRPGPPNHWSEAWINVQLGCAYAAAGDVPQAKTALERAILVGGRFYHPLTSTALVELGRLAIETGDYPHAIDYCQEASYVCFNFPNPGNLEEAFQLGFLAHVLLNQKVPYPPLKPAIAWAKNQGPRQLQATLLLLAAENMILAGETSEASGLLDNARLTMIRTNMLAGQLGARANFLNATVAYQTGNVEAGDRALKAALGFRRVASLWNFQINLADSRYTSGANSNRVAMLLYEALLRDPSSANWSTEPYECLAMLSTDHEAALEHWFELAMKNAKDRELALEIADRTRRHRFFRTLPMGGRLLSLRWLLEGPTELLGEAGLLERQNMLARYPKYAELAKRAADVRTQLAAKPLVDDAVEARHAQSTLLASLARISAEQEVLLREIAVRREPAEMVFPPLRKTEDIQQSLPSGHVLLAFFATQRNLYAFLFSHDRYAAWQIRSPGGLQKELATLLRELGNFDANHALSPTELAKENWRTSSTKLVKLLLDNSNVDLAANFTEIAIVPDGVLWYLPFEALVVGPPDNERLLISQARVRYAPTVGLAVPYRAGRKPHPNVGVALGKLFPHDDPAVAAAAFERLAPAVDGAVALPRPLTAPGNVYRVLLDGLIVLDDVQPADGPYDWAPLQAERGKSSSPLASWLMLPWGGPEQVILPGFHTAAESGIRRGRARGEEVFLAVCGLMASGARTVLISRWRTAGESSFDLVREFAQELPYTDPSEAWQRGVQVISDAPLEIDREPRIKDEGGAKHARPPAIRSFGPDTCWSTPDKCPAGLIHRLRCRAAAAAAGPQRAGPQPGGGRPAAAQPAGPQPAGPRPGGLAPRSVVDGPFPGGPADSGATPTNSRSRLRPNRAPSK